MTNIDFIIGAVESASGVDPGSITGPRRTRSVAYARFAAVWLIRKRYPSWSLKQLSGAVGRADHATAINALRQASRLIQRDESFLNMIRRATAFPVNP